MAITLTGGSGLFTRLGKEYGDAVRQLAYLNTTIPTDWDNRTDARNAALVKLAAIREVAQMLAINHAHDDVPLVQRTIAHALEEIRRQLVSQDYYVDPTSVAAGASSADSTNYGNGTVHCSVVEPRYGVTYQNIRAETLTFTCSGGASSRRTQDGEEVFDVRGEDAVDNLDPLWPKGSGIRTTAYSTTAAIQMGTEIGRNILRNSDFELWSAGVPRFWTAAVGTAGADFAQESTEYYRGGNSIKLIEGTTVLTKFTQAVGAPTTGTAGRIKPYTKYLVSVRLKSAGSSAGVLRLSLRDGSGTVIGTNDAGSGANLSQDLSLLGAGWNTKVMYMQTGSSVPATVNMTVELTTALTNAALYIDDVIVNEPFHPHAGGPFFTILAGSLPFSPGDRLRTAFTNDAAGDMVRHMDRFCNMYEAGINFRTSGSTNIPDSLVA
jgi:hypothetical protein